MKQHLSITAAYVLPGLVRSMEAASIVEVICDYFSMKPEDLRKKTRKQEFVFPRHLGYYLMQKYCSNKEITLAEIGRIFKQDHATVINGIKVINNYLYTKSARGKMIKEVEALLVSRERNSLGEYLLQGLKRRSDMMASSYTPPRRKISILADDYKTVCNELNVTPGQNELLGVDFGTSYIFLETEGFEKELHEYDSKTIIKYMPVVAQQV